MGGHGGSEARRQDTCSCAQKNAVLEDPNKSSGICCTATRFPRTVGEPHSRAWVKKSSSKRCWTAPVVTQLEAEPRGPTRWARVGRSDGSSDGVVDLLRQLVIHTVSTHEDSCGCLDRCGKNLGRHGRNDDVCCALSVVIRSTAAERSRTQRPTPHVGVVLFLR
jgi:hypothetical protein